VVAEHETFRLQRFDLLTRDGYRCRSEGTVLLRVEAAGLTHAGRVCASNEDYVLVDPARRLYIVADGMGGRRAGALASEMAATEISEQLPLSVIRYVGAKSDPDERQRLAVQALMWAVKEANRAVLELGRSDAAFEGMASTILVSLVVEDCLYTAHAGDVRAYLVRKQHIHALTSDHSRVADLVARGRISPGQARTHPQRHLVTRAVGAPREFEPDLKATALRPGDWVILCSDGLWGMLEDSALLALVTASESPEDAAAKLVAEANRAGGSDNVACIVIAVFQEVGRRLL
jgi:serine/threonine protein phosphatase PrpC